MKKIIIFTFILIFTLPSYALEEGIYTIIVKKQQEKKSTRWTLADWLITKKKIAAMDQWLALHSSTNWFDFIIDYGEGLADENSDGTILKNHFKPGKMSATAYIKFLGIEYNKFDYDQTLSQTDWRLNLLLWGSSIQSTHLRLFYGKRDYSYESFSTYDQSFFGVGLNFYLFDFLGTEFLYTNFGKTTSQDNNYSMDGDRTEFGIFTELWILRLYFNKYVETNNFTGSTTSTKKNDGYLFGVKLYF